MTRAAFYTCALLSTGLLAWGYVSGGEWVTALALLGLGVLWIAAETWHQKWFSPAAAAVLALVSAVGLSYGLPALTVFASAALGLAAWDLSVYLQRIRLASPDDDIPGLEGRHLLWLAMITGTGFLLSVLSGLVPVRLSFGWMLLLVLVAVYALARLVGGIVKN
jgi:hypothetical protein